MRNIFVYIIVILFHSNITAQNLKRDLFEAGKLYLNIKNCNIGMNINAYAENTAELEYTVNGTFVKKGNNIFQETDDYIFLVNNQYSLLLSKENKDIIYNELDFDDKEEYSENTEYFSEYLDLIEEVASQYDSVRYLGRTETERKYIIYTSDNMIYKTVVAFDTKNRLVNLIEYYYLPGNIYKLSKLILKFSNDLTSIAEDSFFDEKQILIKKDNEFTPNNKYKNFRVFNNKTE